MHIYDAFGGSEGLCPVLPDNRVGSGEETAAWAGYGSEYKLLGEAHPLYCAAQTSFVLRIFILLSCFPDSFSR